MEFCVLPCLIGFAIPYTCTQIQDAIRPTQSQKTCLLESLNLVLEKSRFQRSLFKFSATWPPVLHGNIDFQRIVGERVNYLVLYQNRGRSLIRYHCEGQNVRFGIGARNHFFNRNHSDIVLPCTQSCQRNRISYLRFQLDFKLIITQCHFPASDDYVTYRHIFFWRASHASRKKLWREQHDPNSMDEILDSLLKLFGR